MMRERQSLNAPLALAAYDLTLGESAVARSMGWKRWFGRRCAGSISTTGGHTRDAGPVTRAFQPPKVLNFPDGGVAVGAGHIFGSSCYPQSLPSRAC